MEILHKEKKQLGVQMIYLMMIDSEEDKRKFEIVYVKYRRLMYKIAKEILNNHSDAEDIVHDSFVKVARNMHFVGETDSKETRNLMAVITRNTAIDLYRKKKRRRERELYVERMKAPSTYERVEAEDTSKLISEAIKQLPDSYRDVMTLRYNNHYSMKEISKLLSISETNVKQRLFRARNKLSEILNGQEE